MRKEKVIEQVIKDDEEVIITGKSLHEFKQLVLKEIKLYLFIIILFFVVLILFISENLISENISSNAMIYNDFTCDELVLNYNRCRLDNIFNKGYCNVFVDLAIAKNCGE